MSAMGGKCKASAGVNTASTAATPMAKGTHESKSYPHARARTHTHHSKALYIYRVSASDESKSGVGKGVLGGGGVVTGRRDTIASSVWFSE